MDALLTDLVDTLDGAFQDAVTAAGGATDLATLTVSQLRYLDAVHRLDRPSITDIATALDVSKAAVTVGVGKLVASGHLRKTRSDEDRRVVRIGLTASGERLVQARDAALVRFGASIRAALSDDEAAQLERIVRKLVDHVRRG